jgi:hypothetical protein
MRSQLNMFTDAEITTILALDDPGRQGHAARTSQKVATPTFNVEDRWPRPSSGRAPSCRSPRFVASLAANEADTIIGANHRGAVMSHVERKSKYTKLAGSNGGRQ